MRMHFEESIQANVVYELSRSIFMENPVSK